MIVDHIGIIVENIHKSIEIYRKLGYAQVTDIIEDEIQNNYIVFLNAGNGTFKIELIQAIDERSSVFNFKHGYHHICYDVSRIYGFEEWFNSMKIGKIFASFITAPAIDNRKVAFALLRSGNFVEFILD